MAWWNLFDKPLEDFIPQKPGSIRPSDKEIEVILSENGGNYIPVLQWVNWGIDYLGLNDEKIIDQSHAIITMRRMWIIYEACRKYKEDNPEVVEDETK
jgi:hypothetical protein